MLRVKISLCNCLCQQQVSTMRSRPGISGGEKMLRVEVGGHSSLSQITSSIPRLHNSILKSVFVVELKFVVQNQHQLDRGCTFRSYDVTVNDYRNTIKNTIYSSVSVYSSHSVRDRHLEHTLCCKLCSIFIVQS